MTDAGKPVLWDVDTQIDFVLSSGHLAVPGAEEVVPQMARLVAVGPCNRGRPCRVG